MRFCKAIWVRASLVGQFLQASATRAVDIHTGVFSKEDQSFWLLVEPLLSSNEDADCLHKWKRTACRRRCLLSARQLAIATICS